MRIGILGTFVWDTIWHPSSISAGHPVEQWGGLAYSLSAFAAAAGPSMTLVPIARIGSDLAHSAHAFVEGFDRVSTEGLKVVSEPNNRVELRYGSRAERREHLTGGIGPWPWSDLRPILETVDVCYINFLSGFELEIDVSERLSSIGKPLYADLHSLFLGPPSAKARQPRRLRHWERWLRCFDAVQMNEAELGLLGPRRVEPLELLGQIPAYGPGMAFVTRGETGAAVATRLADPRPDGWLEQRLEPSGRNSSPPAATPGVQMIEVPASGAHSTGDPTGCGDVWGSVVFASLCAGMAVDVSMIRGHIAAAAKMGVGRIDRISDTIRAALRNELPGVAGVGTEDRGQREI